MSKSAKKRARKQAQQQAQAAGAGKPKANGKSEPAETPAAVEPVGAANKANGESESVPAKAASEAAPAVEKKEEKKEVTPAASSSPVAQLASSLAPPAPVKELSPPSSPTFSPALPPTLPQPSNNQLPANRKRKAPQDFTPSGPGAAFTPSSPSKNSVKFEDGVLPGEGKEGEKTIAVKDEIQAAIATAPKKHQNAIERTVWTFIMIFGFISGCPAFGILADLSPPLHGSSHHDHPRHDLPGYRLQGGHCAL